MVIWYAPGKPVPASEDDDSKNAAWIKIHIARNLIRERNALGMSRKEKCRGPLGSKALEMVTGTVRLQGFPMSWAARQGSNLHRPGSAKVLCRKLSYAPKIPSWLPTFTHPFIP
jgi:hypothetical protein